MSAALIIRNLQHQLERAATPATKAWFENYLKHVIQYRGVKSPEVSTIVSRWRLEQGLNNLPTHAQLDIASSLMRQTMAEDKFAGIFYIQKYLLGHIEDKELISAIESLFKAGAFWDWSTTDWLCVRVVDPLVLRNGQTVARRVAAWHRSKVLWQRRASIVAFRGATKFKSYHSLIEGTISKLVIEDERFIQTAVGWVISDLSKTFPGVAQRIVDKHFERLSGEVIKRHTTYLHGHSRYVKAKRKCP
jgi:3-methyladenine DNA glycosylase AlkD